MQSEEGSDFSVDEEEYASSSGASDEGMLIDPSAFDEPSGGSRRAPSFLQAERDLPPFARQARGSPSIQLPASVEDLPPRDRTLRKYRYQGETLDSVRWTEAISGPPYQSPLERIAIPPKKATDTRHRYDDDKANAEEQQRLDSSEEEVNRRIQIASDHELAIKIHNEMLQGIWSHGYNPPVSAASGAGSSVAAAASGSGSSVSAASGSGSSVSAASGSGSSVSAASASGSSVSAASGSGSSVAATASGAGSSDWMVLLMVARSRLPKLFSDPTANVESQLRPRNPTASGKFKPPPGHPKSRAQDKIENKRTERRYGTHPYAGDWLREDPDLKSVIDNLVVKFKRQEVLTPSPQDPTLQQSQSSPQDLRLQLRSPLSPQDPRLQQQQPPPLPQDPRLQQQSLPLPQDPPSQQQQSPPLQQDPRLQQQSLPLPQDPPLQQQQSPPLQQDPRLQQQSLPLPKNPHLQ